MWVGLESDPFCTTENFGDRNNKFIFDCLKKLFPHIKMHLIEAIVSCKIEIDFIDTAKLWFHLMNWEEQRHEYAPVIAINSVELQLSLELYFLLFRKKSNFNWRNKSKQNFQFQVFMNIANLNSIRNYIWTTFQSILEIKPLCHSIEPFIQY